MKKTVLALFLICCTAAAQFRQPNGADLQLSIDRLSVNGSVLYVAAHPDDENTALLSYFAKGRLLRTGYLSITRGEGGQNAIGPELGSELGVIRTQELLAARRIDGAEQFFTRAVDFGYSKSAEETLRLWDKDSILKDVVFVIRKFRPDIIITRFSPTQGGHGQHLASAILAQEAFKISGDPNVFPEQLHFVRPWKAKRILFNHFRFGSANSNPQNLPAVRIDVGAYNPLLGCSYNELAGISRTMHKSQAMGSSQNKGSSFNEFVVTDGPEAKNDVMDGIDISWARFPSGRTILPMVKDIQRVFNPSRPERSIRPLVALHKALRPINNNPEINRKMEEVESLIRACAGLWIEARAQSASYTRGDSIDINVTLLNRSTASIVLTSIVSPQLIVDQSAQQPLKFNEPFQTPIRSVISKNERLTQPYWLATEPGTNRYTTVDYRFIGSAENPPPLSIAVTLAVEKETMMVHIPVQFKWIDEIDGEKVSPVVVLPPASVSLSDRNIVLTTFSRSQKARVSVRSNKADGKGTVRLRLPEGWRSSPAGVDVVLKRNNEETEIEFTISADSNSVNGRFAAELILDGEVISSDVSTIRYPHIPPQTILKKAEGKVLNIPLEKRGENIGYIMGAGDDVPKALHQMGYHVSFMTDGELRSGNFKRYDAVIAGIRAYNTREQLRHSHASLMKYVETGGTYIVQYQVLERGQTDAVAPYPLTISRDRVTDESAKITFLDSLHPLLNGPNKITQDDFSGWVQERGLYFANAWDKQFTPVISCADPNEKPLEGSLLTAPYGNGHYIFTGLSFFRQLPAGVPGAYRLLANLVSVGQ